MIRKFINFLGLFLILLFFSSIYLSYFGIETKKFNQLIKDQILKKDRNININLNKVKIILDIKSFSLNIKTIKPEILYKNNKIKLNSISSNFSLNSFFNKKIYIDDLNIKTEEIKIKDIISIIKKHSPSIQLIILEKIIKGGSAVADININFNDRGEIKKDYELNILIKDGSIKILNTKRIKNINLKMNIKDKYYSLNNIDLNFDGLKFFSKSINIKEKNKIFFIDGDINNNNSNIKNEILSLILNDNLDGLENVNLNSESIFSFNLNKKFKINNLKLQTNIGLNSLSYSKNLPELKKILPNFNNKIKLINHTINLTFQKNQISIDGKGTFSINKDNEFIEYNLEKKENDYLFKSKINIKDNPILIEFIDYQKKSKISSEIKFEGAINKNQNLYLNNFSFIENKNKIYIKGLDMHKNFKINSVKEISLDFLNDKKKQNIIKFKKDKKNYEIDGKIFDATKLINNILESDNNNGLSIIFDNLNTNINIKIDKTFIDQISHTDNLRGNIKIINNEISKLNLISNFSNNKKITLTINTNEDNEKTTTLFSNYPKPLVNRYKFIKGFEEGVLDFQSTKKGNVSKSILNIDNFKVKEVPVLAKLLSLASLQGIADLLTGEGIRFTDFEMKFSNEDNLMKIEEIYAIGPAISIMMNGYIESEKLISLRGTLVPARTINRTIASIPLIGKVLVGEKTGEGVFGVSFKIKGPPKDLKTTVNPVKTLTPRFITRTLEKIKKN